MTRPIRALIDLQALQSNFQKVRSQVSDCQVMAIVKANAYGHGLIQVASALSDADAFGVASLEEALALRMAGLENEIVLLEGVFELSEIEMVDRFGLQLVVHTREQLAWLKQAKVMQPIRTWVKVDSGMHRLGFPVDDVPGVSAELAEITSVHENIRYLSHLASADERGGSSTSEQLGQFQSAIDGLTGERSLANSAGILVWTDTHMDWVRPGIMLYGVSPMPDECGMDLGLVPVMTLVTKLISVLQCKKGDAIGYGGSWVCPEDMLLGVAAVGYGDGYPRHAQTDTPVLVNGRRAALVGRVSMDMISIDLRDHQQARCGDPVQLWGADLPVEEVAKHANTIAYELLCGVKGRVSFEYN